ncbi:MAG TPA: HDOD domain-containing protein [Pirellulales bacterium]|nr:HDOD domain-containing protein [Pirellulales bacterium]
MSSDTPHRVLVVEDDAALAQAIGHSLSAEGFVCDFAANGVVAGAMLVGGAYDILLTDLRLPMLNGHALSVATLARQPRPLVIVLTGVVEPRLAADLLIRGVDDVVFKPVPVFHLAAKFKALLARRTALERRGGAGTTTVSAADLEQKLANVRYALPISQAALDVVRLTSQEETSVRELAEALARDASLAVEVLRLANSQFYINTSQKIMDLEEAIVRIGTRRVAEIASATSALVGIADRTFTWMNSTLLWRQSMASGIAMGRLMEHVHLSDHSGLYISALTQGLGRVVLGTLYPGMYELLTRSCAANGESLLDQEDRCFPSRHSEVMATILANWGFPPTVYGPLRHTLSSYDELQSMSDPLRTKVELCKIAGLVGRIATGWEPFDVVEPAPGAVVARLNLPPLAEIVEETRAALEHLDVAATGQDGMEAETPLRSVGYVSLSSRRGDILPEVLASMGLTVRPLEPERLAVEGNIIVNCGDVPAKRLAPYLGSGLFAETRLVVTDLRHLEDYRRMGTAIRFPMSYAALMAACEAVAADAEVANAFLDAPA